MRNLFTTASLGALAFALAGCAATKSSVESPPQKIIAGKSLTEPVVIEACDAKGFKVWQNTPINMRSLKVRGNPIEEYNGHIIEYNDPSYAKVFGLAGLVAGAAGGRAGVAIAGGIIGYLGGSKLDAYLTPEQLIELRKCKNYLDSSPRDTRTIPYRRRPVPSGFMSGTEGDDPFMASVVPPFVTAAAYEDGIIPTTHIVPGTQGQQIYVPDENTLIIK